MVAALNSCQQPPENSKPSPERSNAGIIQPKRNDHFTPLLDRIEIVTGAKDDERLQEVLTSWKHRSKRFVPQGTSAFINLGGKTVWTHLVFRNPDSLSRRRVLYFPKGWSHLECYVAQPNGSYYREDIGTLRSQEIVQLEVTAKSEQNLYVRYPAHATSYYPSFEVVEFGLEEFKSLQSRAVYKFLLLGVLIFPVLFFLVQFLVQKDKLNFFYLLFLSGSGLYLLTMLDTIPFFELNPKIITSMGIIQRMFVTSTLILLFGLVKFLHSFLQVSSWSPKLAKVGDGLLIAFFLVVTFSLVYPVVFRLENYSNYLQYFRIIALALFLYVPVLITRAHLLKIEFSRLISIAFAPFLLCGIWYGLWFIMNNGYSSESSESLLLIVGFMLTLLLFGVVLGVRNNALKAEKLRLQQQTDHLHELDRFKTRFYTNISHEFRTPLTVIKGMTGDADADAHWKKVIQRNCDQLLSMVNQLLDLSKLESGKLTLHYVHGDIVPYLQYLVESFHSLARRKDITLSFSSDQEDIEMDYDDQKVHQIVTNLLSNAIKFTGEYGSIKLITSTVSENNTPYLKLTVSDTGVGIAAAALPHIFDRFFQASDSARHGEGSGIGLSLVRELVHLLEGRVEVESEVGVGTTFRVHLPIHHRVENKPGEKNSFTPAVAWDDEEGSDHDQPRSVEGEHKPIVLVIEDNRDVANYIISCLRENYQWLAARNGKDGVAQALEHVPDVILCDVMMPEMDGFEVCRTLKADRRTSHIPIVLLTAKSAHEDKLEGLSQGADAYLTKPFDKEELLIRLANLSANSIRLRELLRERLSSDAVVLEDAIEAKEVPFLKEINAILEANISHEEFDTLQLCDAVAMSRTQLHRKLKALTGKSTAHYIRTTRLQRAKVLLQTTDFPIGEIAVQVGYKDFSHFSRSFYKEFGVQPSVLRTVDS